MLWMLGGVINIQWMIAPMIAPIKMAFKSICISPTADAEIAQKQSATMLKIVIMAGFVIPNKYWGRATIKKLWLTDIRLPNVKHNNSTVFLEYLKFAIFMCIESMFQQTLLR